MSARRCKVTSGTISGWSELSRPTPADVPLSLPEMGEWASGEGVARAAADLLVVAAIAFGCSSAVEPEDAHPAAPDASRPDETVGGAPGVALTDYQSVSDIPSRGGDHVTLPAADRVVVGDATLGRHTFRTDPIPVDVIGRGAGLVVQVDIAGGRGVVASETEFVDVGEAGFLVEVTSEVTAIGGVMPELVVSVEFQDSDRRE